MIGMLAQNRVLAKGSQQSEPVQARHHDIGQQQGRPQQPGGLQRLAAIRNRMHLIAAIQQAPEVLAHVRVVVRHDDQIPAPCRF